MITFIHNGTMYCGPSCQTLAQRAEGMKNEVWNKTYGTASSAQDRKWGKMRPARMRTLAVMARSLYAEAKARRGARAMAQQKAPAAAPVAVTV